MYLDKRLLCLLPLVAACHADDPAAAGDPGPDASVLAPDASGCPVDVTARPGTVLTTAGAVTGALAGSTWSWKGIPYAAPPVGDLRWKPPVAPACWSGERAAVAFGPACPQLDRDTNTVTGNEDCLTLNVWAPSAAAGAPVLVFIHGGGNTVGSASDPLYDGNELATRTGSIVVTLEYRLGALGYFAHAGLTSESADHVSGNYGLLDQSAALAWVKANISGFGGDPSRVMIFGESAGGQDTLLHLVTPRSKGLFSRALVESGGTYKTTLADGISQLAAITSTVGCAGAADEVACMRAVPAATLAAIPTALTPTESGLHYTPLIDGVVLPDNPEAMIGRGDFTHVPFAIGSNAQETSRMVPTVTTEQQYTQAVYASYGVALGNQLLALYPASDFPSPRAALIKMTTDAIWTCPTRRLARAAAATQSEPVFRYFFSWHAPGATGQAVGATHGLELPFVFRAFSAVSSSFQPGPEDVALSESMQGYWSRFAETGDPNGGGAVTWPRYLASGDAYLGLDTTIAAGEGVSTAKCDAMDAILASQ